MMTTLVEFLLARVAEDEAVARAVLGEATARGVGANCFGNPRAWIADDVDAVCLDPARVLAECEAKRRIVALHRPKYAVVYSESERLLAEAFDQQTMKVQARSGPIWPTEESECTLRILALPFADHPDYDEAWKA